ncbi:hypothetical protein GCM10022386_07270 [Flavobacterium cheonhonense]|uniref:Uncharacterized protein n=1 Tax=Flavobacterium cheonhonense TaxID=706185 RepID=A0ABP7THN3_9FLAO|nr:hypothetical protein [Flavobacterium cheonhonense]
MLEIVGISKKVLERLNDMKYELHGGDSEEQLIFPKKIQGNGKRPKDRISEQELRQLFIEEFKLAYSSLFYSIETPTIKKYRFRDTNESVEAKKQSALHDMCVFEKVGNDFKRRLNIEFKYGNRAIGSTAKDIEKLICEEENGAFIHLLKNTRRDTLCNEGKTGVFDKLYKSFLDNNGNWIDTNKSILLIIISLNQKTLIHREIKKGENFDSLFSFDDYKYGNIKEVNGNSWNKLIK